MTDLKYVSDDKPFTPADEVICGCGDVYPANSYGAGWIDAVGQCEHCDTARPVESVIAELRRLREEIAHDEQRVADLMADVQRIAAERDALRALLRRARHLLVLLDDDGMWLDTLSAIDAAIDVQNPAADPHPAVED